MTTDRVFFIERINLLLSVNLIFAGSICIVALWLADKIDVRATILSLCIAGALSLAYLVAGALCSPIAGTAGIVGVFVGIAIAFAGFIGTQYDCAAIILIPLFTGVVGVLIGMWYDCKLGLVVPAPWETDHE